MNWYARYKLAADFRGEYWIDESGNATFADGDVGDLNHEAIAMQRVQGEYADEQFNRGEYIDWDGFVRAIASEKLQEGYQNPAAMTQILSMMGGIDSADQIGNANLYELAHQLLLQRGMTEEEWEIANGWGDVRYYAAKAWGWKRLQGENIETYSISPNDLEMIANGLYDAYQEEAEQGLFNIWVAATNKWYNDVPYSVIASGSPGALRHYDNEQNANMPRPRI